MEPAPETAPLTEPVPVFETFVTGVAEVDDCRDFFRVTFYVDRTLVGTPESERAIVARLVIPSALYASVADALASPDSERPPLAVAS